MIRTRRPRSPEFMDIFSSSFDSLNLSEGRPGESYFFNPPCTATSPFTFDRTQRRWHRTSYLPAHQRGHLPPHALGEAIQLFTWNLNFQDRFAGDRAHAAINHIRNICTSSAPVVINLQEVNSSALDAILAHAWVREYFQVTDIEPIGNYFTLTLVYKSLSVAQVMRIPFRHSKMGRDVLFVDIEVETGPYSSMAHRYGGGRGGGGGVLRIANVHLESMADGIIEREYQMSTVSKLLTESHVVAGVAAGDMNALLRDDQRLPQSYGLRDAFYKDESLHANYRNASYGDVSDDMGYTCGITPISDVPPTRRDKVLYVGGVSFTSGGVGGGGRVVKRIGMRLKCETGRMQVLPVSDHCGLTTHIVVGSHHRRRRPNKRILLV